MEERNDIVIYKSDDGLVKMEAMVDPVNETIWASQKAIASLFACTKQNVSYHMGKIFASGELERSAVVKEFLTTAQSGARGLSEDKVLYYNLDAIISVGYRINSLRGVRGEVVRKVKHSSVRIENPLSALYMGTEYFSLARTFRTVLGVENQ